METEIGLTLEDAPAAAQPVRVGKRALAATAAACFAAVAAIVYAAVSALSLPGYGTWTGIRPVENKLAQLERFCAAGPVDALALGSSIVDFGFSAEDFSRLMSQRLGREYRVFNFATGGAEPRTLPKLYRLARTACKPRSLFVIAPAEQKLRPGIAAGSPDHALAVAPVGAALASQRLVDLDKALWSQPILRNAPPLRDLFLFGGYRNLHAGMDSYAVDRHGDRLSYLITWKPEDLPVQKRANQEYVMPLGEAAPGDGALAHFFSQTDIDAMAELRRMARQDGAQVYLFSHAGAATYFGGIGENARYNEGRHEFYRAFAAAIGARVVDVDARVDVPWYAISDDTHLNVYGARLYTRAAYAAFVGAPADPAWTAAASAMMPPPHDLFPTTDYSFNPYSALVRRPAHEADALLRFRMVDSSDVPPLPDAPLSVGLRLPDGRDVIAPAIPLGSHEFVAEVRLPASPQPQGLVLRLLYGEGAERNAAMNPLADYEWVHGFPQGADARGDAARPALIAWPPVRFAGEALYVARNPDLPMPSRVALSLAPADGSGTIELGEATLPAGELLPVALPAALAPGRYKLRVSDAQGGGRIDAQAAVEVVPRPIVHPPATVALVGQPSLAAKTVRVRWTGIVKPREHDWVGLFPAGGGPGARLDIVFTGGRASGELDFPIAPSIVPRLVSGAFEFRLYARGGWQILAHSEPFTFDVPPELLKWVPGEAVDPSPGAATPRVFCEKSPRIALGSVKVGWAGIAQPSDQDWVGLFPVGAPAQSRLDFAFTNGAKDGRFEFPISPALAARLAGGEFEFRLYAHGGWNMLAHSGPVRFSRDP